MKRNNLTRLIIVLIVLAWSFYQIYPPTSRDLIHYFQERAVVIALYSVYIVKSAKNGTTFGFHEERE